MSTHNICFPAEIRKIICGYPLLSGALDHPAKLCNLICLLSVHTQRSWILVSTSRYLCGLPSAFLILKWQNCHQRLATLESAMDR